MQLSESLGIKVHNAFENQQLVGMVYYSEAEYQELISYVRKYSHDFANGIGTYLYGDDEIHFVALVEIAKRWKSLEDNDSGFWQYIFSEVLDSEYNQKLWNAYAELIRTLESRGKILIAETHKKYYATLMMHAFAPNKSLNAFFDFVYNFYRRDLDFKYTDNDKNICTLAAHEIRTAVKNIGSKNKDTAIGSGVYRLKIGLRCMSLGCKRTFNELVNLLDISLFAINTLYHGQILTEQNYLFYLVKEWWNAKTEKDSHPINSNYETITTKQDIKYKFVRNAEYVYLRILPIRFSIGEVSKLWISIYDDSTQKRLLSEEIFTRIGEISITSVQKDIELNNLLNGINEINLRIEILENDNNIYCKKLKRDFILFDNKEEINKQFIKDGNYFIYSLTIDDLQLPLNLSTVSKNLYNIYLVDSETFGNKNRTIICNKQIDEYRTSKKVHIIGSFLNCKWKYEETICSVFGNRIDILIPQGISINSLDLRIDNERILFSDLDFLSEDDFSIFDITEIIPKQRLCKLVIYSNLQEKELENQNIIFIPNLYVEFSKTMYFGEDGRIVKVGIGTQNSDLTWKQGDNIVDYPFCNGRLLISIPQLKWRINMGNWLYGPVPKKVWYKEIFNSSSVVEVQAPLDMGGIKMFCIINELKHEVPLNSLSKFEIGRFIYANEEQRSLSFILEFTEPNKQIEIFQTATLAHFTKSPLKINNDKLQFVGDKVYVGDKKPYFKLCLKNIYKDSIFVKSTDLINGILENIPNGIYSVEISAPQGGLFGGGDKLIWKDREFVFGDKEKIKLSNLVLKINPICGMKSKSWQFVKNGYYLSEFNREINDDNYYTAKVFYKNAQGENLSVDGISTCRIEFISNSALKLNIKDEFGKYTQKFKATTNGMLLDPQKQGAFTINNYNFIEV